MKITKSKKLSGISAWPVDDRPREKLLKKGARALSNSEIERLRFHDFLLLYVYIHPQV